MLVPMVINILMVTISLKWQGTPLVVGFLLIVNVALLLRERKHFLPLLTGISSPNLNQERKSWQGTLLWSAGLVLTLSSIVISYSFLILAWSCSILGLLIGISSHLLDKRLVKKMDEAK